MSTTDDVDPAESIDGFYDAAEAYDTFMAALRSLEQAVINPERSEAERKWWEGRREFYEKRAQKSVDRLILMTNVLRNMAAQAGVKSDLLGRLAESLTYRPFDRLPPNPPSEAQLEKALDEAERVRAALTVPITASPADSEARFESLNEAEVALLPENAKIILRATLAVNATDAASREKVGVIIRAHDPHEDPENYKRNFSKLVKDRYLITKKGAIGYWLSAKGRAAAEWLRDHP